MRAVFLPTGSRRFTASTDPVFVVSFLVWPDGTGRGPRDDLLAEALYEVPTEDMLDAKISGGTPAQITLRFRAPDEATARSWGEDAMRAAAVRSQFGADGLSVSRGRGPRTGSYQGHHQPPSPGEGTPSIDDLGSALPDVYEHPEWYAFGDRPVDIEAAAALRAARGNPGARVTIYRAVPPGIDRIDRGNWVTTSISYARQHATSSEGPDWPVLEALVEARHVTFGGNDFVEFGYWGPPLAGLPIARG